MSTRSKYKSSSSSPASTTSNVNIFKNNVNYRLNLLESSDERSSISSTHNINNNKNGDNNNKTKNINNNLFTKNPTTTKLNSILKTSLNKSLTNLKSDSSNQENLINFDDKNINFSNLSNNKPHHSSTPKLNRPQSILINNDEFYVGNSEKKCSNCNCNCKNETRLKSLNNNNNNKNNNNNSNNNSSNYSKISNLNTNENNKVDTIMLDISSTSSSSASKSSNHYQNIKIHKYIEDEDDSEDNDMRRELDNYKLILSDETSNSRTLTDINDTISKLDITDSSDDLDLFIKNLEIRSKNGVKNTSTAVTSSNATNNKNEVFTETQI